MPVFDADGRVAAVAGSTRDTAERTHAEEALRTSDERLTFSLNAGGVGTWNWDIASDRVYCDTRFAKLFGLDPESGVTGADVAVYRPDADDSLAHGSSGWSRHQSHGGDPAQLDHVFQNLLSNSLKYRRKDVPLEVHIDAHRDGERWIIAVKDNGIGFDQRYAERIFGLFKRLHKDEYPGTRWASESSNDAAAAFGRGPSQVKEAPSFSRSREQKGIRSDLYSPGRGQPRRCPEHHVHHELHVVKDGGEALAFVDRMGQLDGTPFPDLVLLDLNLAKVHGSEVLGEFRKHPECARTPVIAITSSDMPKDRTQMEVLGVGSRVLSAA